MNQDDVRDILFEMVEIEPLDSNHFNRVVETLSRIGISSRTRNTLTQSCHVFHKMGRYYIAHFKSLLAMDGRDAIPSDTDLNRVRAIARLLEDWKLVTIKPEEKEIKRFDIPTSNLKIIPFSEKGNWILVVKHSIGKKHRSGF